jgi:hypothetical protein
MYYNLMPLYVAKASSLCTVLICDAELISGLLQWRQRSPWYVDRRDQSVTRQVSDNPLFFYHDHHWFVAKESKADNSWHTQVNTTTMENWKGNRL